MKPNLVRSVTLVVSLLAVCGSLLAHHGNAAYDEDHPITVMGTVTELVWSNPHCQIYLDVKDDKGKVVGWAVESQSPGILHRNGWTKSEFKPGDQVTISFHPAKNGNGIGLFMKAVFPDGTVAGGGGSGQGQ